MKHIDADHVQLKLYPHALANAVIDELMQLPYGSPSTVYEGSTPKDFRTSTSAVVTGEAPAKALAGLVNALKKQGYLPANCEPESTYWGLHTYTEGQQFKAHNDAYDKLPTGIKQRVATCLIYLNTVSEHEGGATEFPNILSKLQPVKGLAVTWHNLLPNGKPNPAAIHVAHPVQNGGVKRVLTMWFVE